MRNFFNAQTFWTETRNEFRTFLHYFVCGNFYFLTADKNELRINIRPENIAKKLKRIANLQTERNWNSTCKMRNMFVTYCTDPNRKNKNKNATCWCFSDFLFKNQNFVDAFKKIQNFENIVQLGWSSFYSDGLQIIVSPIFIAIIFHRNSKFTTKISEYKLRISCENMSNFCYSKFVLREDNDFWDFSNFCRIFNEKETQGRKPTKIDWNEQKIDGNHFFIKYKNSCAKIFVRWGNRLNFMR